MNIYELTGAYRVIEAGMLLNQDDEELALLFEQCKDALHDKADGYAKIIKNLEADMAGLKAEEQRLYDRRKSIERNVERLKNNLLTAMKETGETKFKTELFSFSVAKNGGKEPLVVDVPPTDLPEDMQKVTIEADKDAIRQYIQETGDYTYGHFEDRGEHLNLR